MSRTFETCAALIFLAVASVGFSQTPALIGPKPQVAISVYDYAHVSTGLLAAAEEDAQRVFRQAGVETVWATCLPKPEKTESDGCYAVDANHLMLKILPRAIAAHVRDRGDVLGTAVWMRGVSDSTLMSFMTMSKDSLRSENSGMLCSGMF